MQSQEHARKGTLEERVKELFIGGLAQRGPMTADELGQLIPDELAHEKAQATSAIIYQDAGPVVYGRAALTAAAVKALLADELCETRRQGGKDLLRLLAPPDTAGAAGEQGRRDQERTEQPPEEPTPAGVTGCPAPCAPPAAADPPAPPQQPEPDLGLPVHEVAGLFPLPTEEEYRQLKNDIAARGQLVPAWVYEGKLIDGRSRARAWRELGLDLRVQEWDGRGSLVAFVVSLNLHRRHLSESQRALVAARLKPLFETEARQRMLSGKAGDPGAHLPQGRTRDQAAAAMGVSPRTVEAAGKVLRDGAPELIQGVESGQVSVSAGSSLAELPHDEQRDVVAGGKKAAAARAKQLREQKAERRSAKKTQDPVPETGSRGASGADGEKPTAGDKASAAKAACLVIQKSDRPAKIARLLIEYLGAERAAKVGGSAPPPGRERARPLMGRRESRRHRGGVAAATSCWVSWGGAAWASSTRPVTCGCTASSP
jgi:hypothetical protein